MATVRRVTAQRDATMAMMVAGDNDNDVDEDGAMGNEVDDNGDGAGRR
jgi:hypothetical protein